MKARELFAELENCNNIYGSFRKGTKYVTFSTGGLSDNED